MQARIVYQALLFFNSTLLYTFALRTTGNHDLLFFSAFAAALSLTANLAVQLSNTQFHHGIWIVKGTSITLLLWVCITTGINSSVTVFLLSVVTILTTNREALIGSPRLLTIAVTTAPILITTILIGITLNKHFTYHSEAILILLILPYLLAGILNRFEARSTTDISEAGKKIDVIMLILSQLLPTASSIAMLSVVSVEKDVAAISRFVMMERAVAIGGSLIYFYARVKQKFPPVAPIAFFAFALTSLVILVSTTIPLPGIFLMFIYLTSGCLLSFGTISMGSRHASQILTINAVAMGAVLLTVHFTKLQPTSIFAIYIFSQLLPMGFLANISARKNA